MYNLLNYQTLEVLDRMKLVKEFYDEGSFRIVDFMGKMGVDYDDFELYCWESLDEVAQNVDRNDLFYEDDEDITEDSEPYGEVWDFSSDDLREYYKLLRELKESNKITADDYAKRKKDMEDCICRYVLDTQCYYYGGLSDAFKRAAVKWNIGRYLYSFEPVWITAEKRGRAFVIAKSENGKLETAYNTTVARLFGTEAPKGTTTITPPPAQKQGTTPPPAPAITQPQNNGDENADVYEVRKINVQNNQSSMLLFGKGKQFQAFMQGADEHLKVGTRIKNVNAGRGQNSYGTYAILNSYDIAA